ncbi:MAG: DUF1080 domain-containing protein [Sedimentisphaerales bacterium]|nr:DUF1080 domain-containing protein [Sedimentisphaerales bacterium]
MAAIGSHHRDLTLCRSDLVGHSRGGILIRVLPVLATLGLLVSSGCYPERQEKPVKDEVQAEQPPQAPAVGQVQAAPEPEPQAAIKPGQEISLFDGQTLGQWTITDFGGQGDVSVKDGAICLPMGNYMTGITWAGPVIRMNYEISLEAMRVEGNDFFCGLTFPVAENPCTLILGGWGGSVCGLSSLDHYDASENETTRMISFEKGKWYKVRLRVVPDRIQAWLDDEDLVDVDITGRKVGIRIEVDLSQPLGIATYATTGAIRNIRLKALPDRPQ